MGSTDQLNQTASTVGGQATMPTAVARPAWFGEGVWPAVVAFLLGVQLATGLLLMTAYSPSTQSAWGSVWYIQTVASSGAIIRGLHHFAADAMLLTVAVWVLRSMVRRGYVRPGGWVWAITLVLGGLTLATSLTGELLPWDQAGYWGTRVRLNILARTPLVGDALRRLLIGGAELGQLTLTRFHALHVIVLPALLAILLWCRARLSRRIDVSAAAAVPQPLRSTDPLMRITRGSVACAVALAAVLAVVWYASARPGLTLLDAPADPTASDYPARPEWHTLFLYQWLKYFSGPTAEVVGAIAVPGGVALLFLAFPVVVRVLRERIGHGLVLSVTGLTLASGVVLTAAAFWADRNPSDDRVNALRAKQSQGTTLSAAEQAVLRAREFHEQRARVSAAAARAFQLAAEQGIPPAGPLELLAGDPLTRGAVLFAASCASCHRYAGHDGLGRTPGEPATSSDLSGYGTREWIRSLLADPMADRHFGRMKKPDGEPAHTRMRKWLSEQREKASDEESRKMLSDDLDAAAAYLADESQHPGRLTSLSTGEGESDDQADTAADADEALIRRGRRVFMRVCNECHAYKGERWGTFNAPEMFGYGSVPWIEAMVADPSDDARYRSKGRESAQMPAFKDRLSERDRSLIARWLHESGLRERVEE